MKWKKSLSISSELKANILGVLLEELVVSLFNLWHDLQDEYKQTASLSLSPKGTGFPYRFSESKLQKLGLPRHAETLALLGKNICFGHFISKNQTARYIIFIVLHRLGNTFTNYL